MPKSIVCGQRELLHIPARTIPIQRVNPIIRLSAKPQTDGRTNENGNGLIELQSANDSLDDFHSGAGTESDRRRCDKFSIFPGQQLARGLLIRDAIFQSIESHERSYTVKVI